MKKLALYIVIIGLVSFFNCSSKNTKTEQADLKPIEITLSGRVEVFSRGNDSAEVYLVERWATKSRVTYRVKNHEKVIDKEGKILVVKAKLYEKKDPYSGVIEVLKILEQIE
ncbi:MAG: hypothetical protein KKH98_04520 [Spirochaetes bacterium]|nr:hypothetical protein [Spirochaetota bacterium]